MKGDECNLGSLISDIYSPPRITAEAARRRLRQGFAIDLATGWDLRESKHRKALLELIEREVPFVVVGSPPCTVCSTLQRMSQWKVDPWIWEENEGGKVPRKILNRSLPAPDEHREVFCP